MQIRITRFVYIHINLRGCQPIIFKYLYWDKHAKCAIVRKKKAVSVVVRKEMMGAI